MIAASRRSRRLAGTLGAAIIALTPVACGGEAPTEPLAQQLMLSNAQVVVDGRVMNGQTMHAGGQFGSGTLFRARLHTPRGPALGYTVRVLYEMPHGMMGMPRQGAIHLFDDGTHGDPVPGDGEYCFEDLDGYYGFHRHDSPHGQYMYEFYGVDHHDHHSNHMTVWVTLAND